VVALVSAGGGGVCARAVAVFEQERHARESSSTDGAVVLLDVGVRLQVRAQVGPVSERTSALRAAEWFLAGVRAHVPLQQPRPRERLAAQSAAARQRVCPDVHLERARRRVRFVAVRTPLHVLAAQLGRRVMSGGRQRSAVELTVLRQTADRRVALAARAALQSGGGRRRRRRRVSVCELEQTAEWVALRHGAAVTARLRRRRRVLTC